MSCFIILLGRNYFFEAATATLANASALLTIVLAFSLILAASSSSFAALFAAATRFLVSNADSANAARALFVSFLVLEFMSIHNFYKLLKDYFIHCKSNISVMKEYFRSIFFLDHSCFYSVLCLFNTSCTGRTTWRNGIVISNRYYK